MEANLLGIGAGTVSSLPWEASFPLRRHRALLSGVPTVQGNEHRLEVRWDEAETQYVRPQDRREATAARDIMPQEAATANR